MTKTRTIRTAAGALLCASALLSCSEQSVCPDCVNLPSVSVTVLPAGDDCSQRRVRFVPGEGTAGFSYCIGSEEDLAAFSEGRMPGTDTLFASSGQEVIFYELSPKEEYVVYARAFDSEGRDGGVASQRFFNGKPLVIRSRYVTNTSAAIEIVPGEDWYSCRYYLGREGDRDAFVSGSIPGDTLVDKPSYVLNSFTLEPDSGYVLFAVPVSRTGVEYPVEEFAFSTSSDGPDVKMTVTENNVYSVTALLEPSVQCARLSATVSLVSVEGTMNGMSNTEMLESYYSGDLDAMFRELDANGLLQTSYNGQPLEALATMRSLLECGREIEIFAAMYDEQDRMIGADYFTFSTPDFDPSAPEASASVEIVEVVDGGSDYGTYHSVKAIITPGEGTAGYFVKLMGKSDYDMAMEREDGEDYIRNMLLNDWSFTQFVYGCYPTAFIDEKIYSWYTENYIVVCPFNANGVQGWGPTTAHYFKIK